MGVRGSRLRLGVGDAEPSPARPADVEGVVERAGVRLAWSVYGDHGRPTVLLMPTWSIVPSRFWKLQVPYLARHFRVVTFDGRGSGRSGRPEGAAAYEHAEYAADAVAVLDATGTEVATLVSLSCGAVWSVRVAARHPERVNGLIALAPSCGFPSAHAERQFHPWHLRLDSTAGWAKYNKYYWLEGGYPDFLQFFFGQMFHEPHSTKQIEDCVGWGSQISPQTLVDTTAGRLGLEGATCTPLDDLRALVQCPVVVLHGTGDRISPVAQAERLAELTNGSLVRLEGGGHGPQGRDPVLVNRLIKDFVDGLSPTLRHGSRVRAAARPKKALYLSSPIGLGHARRDLAIAHELRRRHPDLHIDWLAQHPVTTVLDTAGESVHPASAWLLSESGHIEHEAGEHDLNAFRAIRRMDEILVNNFMVFHDLVEAEHYDLVIGDEAWDVDYFLHENPELKRFPFAWMTDFVGWLPMPGGGPREATLTADYNAEMIEQRARFHAVRDRSVFVGNPDDIVEADFGPGLPSIRAWTEENFDFAGYVTGFVPPARDRCLAVRRRLGYDADEPLCVVTVGGSGVGQPLLERVLDAVPLARRMVPGLRFLVVTGPRIDPRSLRRREGVRVCGYLPDLHLILAAADLAVVQGGLTTCMELTACRTPFIYVPLRNHFEQNLHVRKRLERYDAGRCLTYDEVSDPDGLAEAVAREVRREVAYRPVETDGAARAAALLAALL